ncbi:hypothetical protein MTP99_003910 [Tenebrio molitor]|jgi:uncharacterized protein YecT (DUF1311 family)|nr:hypothetical protein MTP99_003910 [Tenebrio molitor]
MGDYEEQVVQCPYNKFHMCLLSRLTKHMWRCHPKEYKRDRDIRLNKKYAEVMRLYQERFQQQQIQQHQQRPLQQDDPTAESWDNDAYPTYVPKKKTYGGQSTAAEVEGQEHQ